MVRGGGCGGAQEHRKLKKGGGYNQWGSAAARGAASTWARAQSSRGVRGRGVVGGEHAARGGAQENGDEGDNWSETSSAGGTGAQAWQSVRAGNGNCARWRIAGGKGAAARHPATEGQLCKHRTHTSRVLLRARVLGSGVGVKPRLGRRAFVPLPRSVCSAFKQRRQLRKHGCRPASGMRAASDGSACGACKQRF